MFGYRSAAEYYQDICLTNCLKDIDIFTICINSDDDPCFCKTVSLLETHPLPPPLPLPQAAYGTRVQHIPLNGHLITPYISTVHDISHRLQHATFSLPPNTPNMTFLTHPELNSLHNTP